MKQVYLFKDWTSASKMRNEKDTNLKIDVGVLLKDEIITGHRITVYNSVTDEIVYRFYIDTNDRWSLNSDEAIEALNAIGFPCEFQVDKIILTDRVREILESVKRLGYSHISRDSRSQIIYLYKDGKDPDDRIISRLSSVTKEYNYHDFSFLSATMLGIEALLLRGVSES